MRLTSMTLFDQWDRNILTAIRDSQLDALKLLRFSSGLSPRVRYSYPNPTLTFGIPSTDASAACLQISNNSNGHLIRNQTRGSRPSTLNSFASFHAHCQGATVEPGRQNIRNLEALATDLNHDDGVLWLGLARKGEWLTTYRSDQGSSHMHGHVKL